VQTRSSTPADDPVRRVLLDLIPCKKSQQVGEAVEMSGTRSV